MNTLQSWRTPAFVTLALTVLVATAAPAQYGPGLVPLYTWYHETRGDFFTTSDPEWRGTADPRGHRPDGYRLVRLEGLVFDPAAPQPPETVPLYHWWSQSRQDNWLTTDPDWAGRVGDVRAGQGDYRLFRIEGYVFNRAVAGTLPLYGLWNSTATDNRTSADPTLWGRVPGRVAATPQLAYERHRLEGHILAAPSSVAQHRDDVTLEARFGRGRLTPNSAAIPILIMLNEWSDVPFPAGTAAAVRTAFAPPPPVTAIGLEQYTSFLSGGTFRFTVAAVVGPFRESITLAQANMLPGGTQELRTRAIQLAAANGVDFRRYDRNGDGSVGPNELKIVRISSDVGVGGQRGAQSVSLPGVTVSTDVLIVASQTPLQGVLHELLHSFDTEDVYGPNFALNGNATVMAGMLGANDHRTMQLDPWHRLQLGWTRLHLHSLAGPPAMQVFALRNADADPARAGVILFHPDRPREYFIVQARDLDDPFDRVASTRGIMVWQVRTGPDFVSLNIPRTADPLGRIAWPRGTDPTQQVQGVLALGADGRLGQPTIFTATSPPITLRWFDGTAAGWLLRVLSAEPGGSHVALVPTTAPLAPRLDAPATPLLRGRTATFAGTMPDAGRRAWSVILRRLVPTTPGRPPTLQQVTLPVRGWAVYGVTVDVPASVAPGRWELLLDGTLPGTSSNRVAVQVRDP